MKASKLCMMFPLHPPLTVFEFSPPAFASPRPPSLAILHSNHALVFAALFKKLYLTFDCVIKLLIFQLLLISLLFEFLPLAVAFVTRLFSQLLKDKGNARKLLSIKALSVLPCFCPFSGPPCRFLLPPR